SYVKNPRDVPRTNRTVTRRSASSCEPDPMSGDSMLVLDSFIPLSQAIPRQGKAGYRRGCFKAKDLGAIPDPCNGRLFRANMCVRDLVTRIKRRALNQADVFVPVNS